MSRKPYKEKNDSCSKFIAHRREIDGKEQCLWEHLKETSFWAGKFAAKIGLEKHGQLIGLLHDLGKASFEFDRYIKSAVGLIGPDEDDYVDATEKKGKLDHSSAGAQVIYRNLSAKGNESVWAAQILSLIIVSHHSGLIDCLTPEGIDNYSRRINKSEEKTRVGEALINLDRSLSQIVRDLLCDNKIVDDINQGLCLLQENGDTTDTFMFKVGLWVRFLFSCLIDADRLSTADFELPQRAVLRNKGDYPSWSRLAEKLERYISEIDRKNAIAALRSYVSEQCLKFAHKPKGLYQLTVPTGGGKTLSSLRFALNHADKHGMDRIIYVIPYTSIIDQNAAVIRQALDDGGEQNSRIMLEHHSNLTPERETARQRILSENWDAPVIFTTMVQFLETLFGYGTRSARRMHQLADAVIIFDEVQTLPVQCVHLFNMAVRFLIKSCGSTVILCTATQPLLNKVIPLQRALQITSEQQIIPDAQRLFKELKRVEVYDRRKNEGWMTDEVVELAKEELSISSSVLIVVNTKKEAAVLFQQLQQYPEAEIYHLSTNMCPAHRMEELNNVKKCLPYTKPVICISTQLIEAGIDIDFGTVIRYLAGLDSIAQAAGRCNRNGERSSLGRVIIINSAKENLERLNDIKIGKEKTERILGEFNTDPEQFGGNLLGIEAMERYYRYYFYERFDIMDYPVSSSSLIGRSDKLFNLLSTNAGSLTAYQRVNDRFRPETVLLQSFMAASKVFHAIDSFTQGVIVPYGDEGCRIISDLCSAANLEKQYRLLKEAQLYSVNVYPDALNLLVKNGALCEVQKGIGIFHLDERYYSDDYGLSYTEINDMAVLDY